MAGQLLEDRFPAGVAEPEVVERDAPPPRSEGFGMSDLTCRVGLGLGVAGLVDAGADLAEVVDALDDLGFDSLWVSDVLASRALDPMATLAFAAARTAHLKLGTSVVVAPGRPPAQLAKEAATLDRLSNGRFLPILGLGTAEDVATHAAGVRREDRGPMVDEMLPLLRRLWSEDEVDHEGTYYQLRGYRPQVHPLRRSLPVWLGGQSRSELRRAGRLADGWLASFATVDEVADSIPEVRAAAAEVGRSVDDDHYGALLLYSLTCVADETAEFLAWRRPDRSLADVLPIGPEALVARLRGYLSAGASKFVLVPAQRPESWGRHLAELADVVDAVVTARSG
jgi:probable F420-dependent oxidoreductase